MSANTGSAPAIVTAAATSTFPKARYDDLVTHSDTGGLSSAAVLMGWMLVAQRERQVTQNKKGLDPEPKFWVQPF
ncbi:hypothetical protein GCM10023238_13140 [Streptomyces heliomycini]